MKFEKFLYFGRLLRPQQCWVRVKTDELTRQNACLLSGGSYQQFVHVSAPSHASLLEGDFLIFLSFLSIFHIFPNFGHFSYVFNGNDIGEIGFTYVVFSYFLTCFNFEIFGSLVFRHYENIYLFEALGELGVPSENFIALENVTYFRKKLLFEVRCQVNGRFGLVGLDLEKSSDEMGFSKEVKL